MILSDRDELDNIEYIIPCIFHEMMNLLKYKTELVHSNYVRYGINKLSTT